MSGDNSLAPSEGDARSADTRQQFEIPPDLAARYDVRIVEAAGSGERRVGMFLSGDRITPALEIGDDRIIARREDPETVASLIKLAQHNRWDAVDVDGSPEFRKAVWSAASRAGLTVNGYEPSFAEAEQLEAVRQKDASRQLREESRTSVGTAQKDPATDQSTTPAAARAVDADQAVAAMAVAASSLTPSETSPAAHAGFAGPSREPAVGRAAEPSTGLSADDRATIERVFERGIRALEATGDPRAHAARETAAALVDQFYGDREDEPTREPSTSFGKAASSSRHRPAREENRERRESDELAELFLHGAAEKIAANPRLASAVDAQAAMERHIAEVFQGDAGEMAAANLESRQLISDVLRRGLQVSVREPAPVRQIEPISPPDLER